MTNISNHLKEARLPLSLCLGVILAVGLLPLAASGQNGGQQNTVVQSSMSTMQPIDVLAASVQRGNTADVLNLVEAVFGSSIFAGAPSSIRNRLSASLSLFLNGSKSAIPIGTLANAANSLALSLSLPKFTNTTPDQIQDIRFRLLSTFPHLLAPITVGGKSSFNELSPAAAFFLVDIVIKQKLLNPQFQQPPDQWEPAPPVTSPSAPTLVIQPPPPSYVSAFLDRVSKEMTDGSSSSAVALGQFLDNASF